LATITPDYAATDDAAATAKIATIVAKRPGQKDAELHGEKSRGNKLFFPSLFDTRKKVCQREV
jgi:hypothetical protein